MGETIKNIAENLSLGPTFLGAITSAFCYYVAVWGIAQEKASRPERNVPQWVDSITPPLYAIAGAAIGSIGGYFLTVGR